METEPLQPKLQQAQKALKVALEEACKVDLSKVDTGELIRIEESLAVAAKAAKEAVSVRLRLRSQRSGVMKQAERPDAPREAKISRRVFDDLRGQRWHVFAVQPSAETTERAALPDAYRHGWLVFESVNELRRMAPIPEKWEELPMDDLRQLCQRAPSSPKRTTNHPPEDSQLG